MEQLQQAGTTVGTKRIERVALMGTHGAGKSTLAEALSKKTWLDAITFSRPTKAANDMGYDKAADVPPHERQLFQWMALFAEVAAEAEKGDGFITDRSTIDFWAYWMLETPDQLKEFNYAAACKAYALRYDLIIYLPPATWGLVDNGQRYMEKTEEIDVAIRSIAQEIGIWNDVLKLEPGTTIDERVEAVVQHLKAIS